MCHLGYFISNKAHYQQVDQKSLNLSPVFHHTCCNRQACHKSIKRQISFLFFQLLFERTQIWVFVVPQGPTGRRTVRSGDDTAASLLGAMSLRNYVDYPV